MADSGHHHLSRRLPSHRPNHLVTSETPTPGNFLLLALPLSSSSWLLQNSFLHATTKLISSWFGPGQLWPSLSGWLWPGPFFLKKKTKNPKIFKNHFKKS
jgi:hypothetical protein